MGKQQGESSAVRRLIISEVLIVVLLLASLAAFKGLYAQKPEVEEKTTEAVRLNVDVYAAEPVDFQELLTGFGTARADRELVVAAQVSGEIVDIHPQLKVGQSVAAGQIITSPEGPSVRRNADLLLKIDPRDFQQRAEQAENAIKAAIADTDQLKVQQSNLSRQLEKAKSVLATLKEEYERIREADARQVATKSELNKALLEVQRYEDTLIQLENQSSSIPLQIIAAEQRLLSSRTDKRNAENDLQRTEVYPSFNGILSEVFVEKGRYVRAGEQLVRLTDPTRVEVPVSLSFQDFIQLQEILAEGTKPQVALAENETAKDRWNGFVVRAAPEADSLSRTVQVYIEVENTEHTTPLLPGTFVYSRINGQTYSQVTLIPREAIVDGSVYVVDSANIARKRSVTPGRRFQSLVAINKGLTGDERVILTNLDIVEDGKEVVVQNVTGPGDEIAVLRSPVVRLLDHTSP